MSDLIVSINVDESRKHNKILIETYEGSIPKLKSKKFSGQLRAVNINAEKTYDNIDFFQFKSIQNLLDDSLNILRLSARSVHDVLHEGTVSQVPAGK